MSRNASSPGLRHIVINHTFVLHRREHQSWLDGFNSQHTDLKNGLRSFRNDVDILGERYTHLQTYTWCLHLSCFRAGLLRTSANSDVTDTSKAEVVLTLHYKRGNPDAQTDCARCASTASDTYEAIDAEIRARCNLADQDESTQPNIAGLSYRCRDCHPFILVEKFISGVGPEHEMSQELKDWLKGKLLQTCERFGWSHQSLVLSFGTGTLFPVNTWPGYEHFPEESKWGPSLSA